VRVFGSVARGESWPAGIPIRSDLDLLVLVSEPIAVDAVQLWP
jgi:predicted nucleotidyltransferase